MDNGQMVATRKTCVICGRMELIQSNTQGVCDRDKEVKTYVHLDVIEEERYCSICDHLEAACYPNPCEHEFEEEYSYYEIWVSTRKKCKLCGAATEWVETEISTEPTGE